jgi:hypothetical protein
MPSQPYGHGGSQFRLSEFCGGINWLPPLSPRLAVPSGSNPLVPNFVNRDTTGNPITGVTQLVYPTIYDTVTDNDDSTPTYVSVLSSPFLCQFFFVHPYLLSRKIRIQRSQFPVKRTSG